MREKRVNNSVKSAIDVEERLGTILALIEHQLDLLEECLDAGKVRDNFIIELGRRDGCTATNGYSEEDRTLLPFINMYFAAEGFIVTEKHAHYSSLHLYEWTVRPMTEREMAFERRIARSCI